MQQVAVNRLQGQVAMTKYILTNVRVLFIFPSSLSGLLKMATEDVDWQKSK